MKGEGTGEGGKAPEDDTLTTTYDPQKSPSTLTAGRILLELKTQGMGEKGTAVQDYAAALDAVEQGVSEAIMQEQIPPAYHDSIRQYFDSIKGSAQVPSEEEKDAPQE